jgi:hypothetical protein
MSAIPKMQLDLDQVMDDHELEVTSIVDAAIADGVEDEKCVVGQYRTTKSQKQAFLNLLDNCDRDQIPVEWVIDIADESNGWFYGTAYHYDDTNQMLHVMVPDKVNPTFDGHVQLDHRTVHLIECADQKSPALFNKIVRDSVMKIKWDVEWYEEYDNQEDRVDPNESAGQWIYSIARYYIRMANQLLVEDLEYEEQDQDHQNSKGFVIITADLNVRLLHCHKNKGIEDYYRLINEGIVSFTPEAEEEAHAAIQNMSQLSPIKDKKGKIATEQQSSYVNQSTKPAPVEEHSRPPVDKESHNAPPPAAGSSSSSSNTLTLRRLTEVVRHLKDSFLDIIDDYEQKRKEDMDIATLYQSFVLQGDLEKGLQLMDFYQKLQTRHEKRKSLQKKFSPTKSGDDNDPYAENENDNENDNSNVEDDLEERKYRKLIKTLEYASHNSNKLEKQCMKLIKHGFDINAGNGMGSPSGKGGNNAADELELLKKEMKKMKKDMDAKDQELRVLKNSNQRR